MPSVTLTIPPTLNSSYRAMPGGGGQYKTKEAKQWEHDSTWLLKKFKPLEGQVSITVRLYYKVDRDIDASLKLLLDCLQGYAYADDKQIVEATLSKEQDSTNPRVEVEWGYA